MPHGTIKNRNDMKVSPRTKKIITNVLIAIGISLLVNFADILFVIRTSTEFSNRLSNSPYIVMDTVVVEGRQYIIPAFRFERMRRDSINKAKAQYADQVASLKPFIDSLFRAYVRETMAKAPSDTSLLPKYTVPTPSPDIQRQSNMFPPNPYGFGKDRAHARGPSMIAMAVTQAPPYQQRQLIYYFILGFAIMSAAVYQPYFRKKPVKYFVRLLACMVLAVMGYFFAPNVAFNGEVISTFRFSGRDLYDTTLLLKCSMVFVVAALYGKIYELTTQRQNILLENEKLKSENLQATYSTLINQMNPHFFFNSLNSLSMLVREKHNAQALKYIDRLSDTFRYILQNGASGMITLEEELKFTDAYKYLLEVRYEGKLFVDMNVDHSYMLWKLPSFTLQPLIENAVKHNSITRSEPLHITITTGDWNSISVSNTVNPKMDKGEGTGIGLSNLSERYRLLTGKDITVIHNDMEFTVILPLIPPEK